MLSTRQEIKLCLVSSYAVQWEEACFPGMVLLQCFGGGSKDFPMDFYNTAFPMVRLFLWLGGAFLPHLATKQVEGCKSVQKRFGKMVCKNGLKISGTGRKSGWIFVLVSPGKKDKSEFRQSFEIQSPVQMSHTADEAPFYILLKSLELPWATQW